MHIDEAELRRRIDAAVNELRKTGRAFVQVKALCEAKGLTSVEVGRCLQQAVDLCEEGRKRLSQVIHDLQHGGTPEQK